MTQRGWREAFLDLLGSVAEQHDGMKLDHQLVVPDAAYDQARKDLAALHHATPAPFPHQWGQLATAWVELREKLDARLSEQGLASGYDPNAERGYRLVRTMMDSLVALPPRWTWRPLAELPPRAWDGPGVEKLVTNGRRVFLADACGVLPDRTVSGRIPACHGPMTSWGITHWMDAPEPETVETAK